MPRRPLLDGYLEGVELGVFEKYNRQIADLIGSRHGVYALYKNHRLYYVGLAVNLRRRLKSHLQDKHVGKWNRFSLYLVRNVEHIKEIESLLLRIADPRGNTQGGRIGRAKDLRGNFRKLIRQYQKDELNKIVPVKLGSFSREKAVPRTTRRRKKVRRDQSIPLKGIVSGKRIYASYKGKDHTAVVLRSGRIRLNRQLYNSPSGAAKAIRGKATNGWVFWKIRHEGELIPLSKLKK